MSLNRPITWLVAWGVQLLVVSASWAQIESQPASDYLPEGVVEDAQIFDQADLSLYGNGPRRPEGLFGSWERLYWATNVPENTTIGREGFNPITFDGAGFATQPNSLDLGFIAATLEGGSRIEFGLIQNNKGWMFSS